MARAASTESILVTGGAGFIGGCFVRAWIRETGGPVVNLDKLTYAGNLDSLAALEGDPRHVFVKGDVGDAQLVADLLARHRPRAIVHLAAETHVDRSIDGPEAFLRTNIEGTFRLLEAARAYRDTLAAEAGDGFRFLHVSTDEVYGSLPATGRFGLRTPYAPNSPYAATKAAADHLVHAWHVTYGLPTIVTNCSNNYGPYQFPEKLVPLMIRNALAGRPLPVYGDGGNVRDWLHVEDHCEALRLVLERGRVGEVYLVGGDAERTNLQVVHAICRAVDRRLAGSGREPCSTLVSFVTDRPGHDRRYAIDATKLREQLGWRPRHGFETGIAATVDWYADNVDWVERVTQGTYRGERLGLDVRPA